MINGSVFCWGNNEFGQLGTGDTNGRLAPTLVSSLPTGAFLMSHLRMAQLYLHSSDYKIVV
jgi:alpha-tubulin suppressor-like RCC1 family protein